MLRIISTEEAGVDHDPANYSGQSEMDDAPVVSRRAPPPRLPAVHPFSQVGVFAFDKNGRVGLKEIFLRREKLVVDDEHNTTKSFRSKINQFSKIHLSF